MFRYELGRILWASTVIDGHLDMQTAFGIHASNYQEINRCLEMRPAVLSGVTGLHIGIKIPIGRKVGPDFENCCDFLSAHLQLQFADYYIKLDHRDMRAFLRGEERGLYGLQVASKLQISERFRVHLETMDYTESEIETLSDEEDLNEDDAHLAYLGRDYTRKDRKIISDYMWPFSLNPQEPKNEGEKYLQERADAVTEGKSHTTPTK